MIILDEGLFNLLVTAFEVIVDFSSRDIFRLCFSGVAEHVLEVYTVDLEVEARECNAELNFNGSLIVFVDVHFPSRRLSGQSLHVAIEFANDAVPDAEFSLCLAIFGPKIDFDPDRIALTVLDPIPAFEVDSRATGYSV